MYNKKLTDTDEIRQTLFMTYPIYKSDILLNPQEYFLFAAYKDKIPVALAVFNKTAVDKVEMVSIFTDKPYRNSSIAKELLKFSFEGLKKEGLKSVTVIYMDKKLYTDTLENILDSFGFGEKTIRQSVISLVIEKFLQEAKYSKKLTDIPEGFLVLPWSEVTEEDMSRLDEDNNKNNWIPKDLHPSLYLKHISKEFSYAVFHNGLIVSWIIAHRLSKDTLRFTCSYTKEDFKHFIFQIRVSHYMRDNMIADGIKYLSWTTPYEYKTMINFNKKWMGRYSQYEGFSKERSLGL